MNLGASAAIHDRLLFLHLDTSLPANAMELVSDALRKGLWGRFDVELTGSHPLLKLISWSMNLRSRFTGVATGDQAVFVQRRTFEEVCGFPVIPLMEDIALAKKLRQKNRPVCLRQTVSCSGRRWEQQGVIKTIVLMWFLRLAWFIGASPDWLARIYYPGREYNNLPVYENAVIQLFAKPPLLGRVKTRLAADIGEKAALEVYTSLLFRQLSRLKAMNLCHVQVWVDGDFQWFNQAGLSLYQQSDGDLGDRMAAAIKSGLREYSRVVLIGSDCPFLDEHYLAKALSALDEHKVVIGPATDGGYVLLGQNEYIDEIFRDILWSTSEVLADTILRLNSTATEYALLPPVEDVDNLLDLQRVKQSGFFL
jgi:rSAM/selenodomain-associated transferase 1